MNLQVRKRWRIAKAVRHVIDSELRTFDHITQEQRVRAARLIMLQCWRPLLIVPFSDREDPNQIMGIVAEITRKYANLWFPVR